jgi:hypothetical protein
MKEENAQYLEKRLVYTGFGEELIPELRQKMAEGKEKFELHFEKEINGKKVEANLKYSLSTQGNYFFNSYDLKINRPEMETLERSFKVSNQETFSLKEAFNLLEGRSVLKTSSKLERKGDGSKIEELKSWSYLDFGNNNRKGEPIIRKRYDYDLEAQVSKLHIKNLEIPAVKADLLQSLERGNLQSVMLEKDGNYKKHYLEALPKYNTITIYDENLVKQFIPHKKKEELTTDQKQSDKLVKRAPKQGKNKKSQGVQ